MLCSWVIAKVMKDVSLLFDTSAESFFITRRGQNKQLMSPNSARSVMNLVEAREHDAQMGLSENVGYIPNEIAI